MPKLQKTEHPHIVRVPGVVGGRPVVRGSRISVDLIARFLRDGVDAAEISATYPHIAPAAIYDAISYYFDHKDEVDQFLDDNTPEKLAERYGFVVQDDGRVVFNAR